MKTYVLFFSLLSAYFFQNEPQNELTNVDSHNECPYAEAQPQYSAAINTLAGNSAENRFKKAIHYAGNYYIIGQNGLRASLHKMDPTGAIVWSREVTDTSSWNDLIINSDNNILLVGSVDISSGLPRDVLVGVFDLNGNQVFLNSYNYFINESYNSITANPLHVTADTRYLVVGSANRTNNRNDDDVIVTTMNPNGGTTGTGWRKRYGQLNVDDEFHSKITLFDGVAGQLALLGKLNNQGVYVVINGSGIVNTTLGRSFGLNATVNDLVRTPNNEILVASSINAPSPQSQIIKVTSTNANRFISRNASLTEVYQIVHRGGNQYYALATRTSGPVLRPCIIEFNDIGNDLTYNAAWEYNNGESYMERGHLQQTGLTDFIYTDSRTNSAQGLGMLDGFIALHEGGLDSCGMKRFNPSFSRLTYNEVIVTPSSTNETTLEPFIRTSAPVSYLTKPLCNFKCITEISVTKSDCGKVQFNCFTNLSGTVNYCWDFGTVPPCASVVQNPQYTYAFNGNYTVCVTVNNGQNNCSSCQTITINNADNIPPNISCPPNITIDCSASKDPSNTGFATATDNVDPNPTIQYTDIVIQSGACRTEILRDWSATDDCNNVIHCQQTIIQSDTKAPEISCPEGIDLNCNSDTNPNSTGWPTFSDNCQVSIVTSYLDEETSGPCPRIIKRKFTVTDLCQNSSTCIQEIRLWDLVPPVISNCFRKFTYQGSTEIGDSCAAYVHIQPPVAVDDCDGMVNLINNYNGMGTLDNYLPDGTTIIQWTATDLCGNTATCVDTVCVLGCEACPDTCLTNIILISTGHDPIDEILLPPGSSTSQWTLVGSPLWGGSGSAPSYVINPYSGWDNITGSHWLSAHPFADWTQNNPAPDFIPYTFQNCFCVCQDSTLVGIKIDTALADDAMDVCLVDEFGNLIENLLSISSSGSTDHTPFDGSVIYSSSHTFTLNEGKYCIQVKLRNLHGAAMGFNILGKVFGVGLLGSACCEQKNFVTGYKFIDKKCNGVRDGSDMPGANWEIQLKDVSGAVIATTQTLGDGFYAFQDVPIGHYTVCEVAQNGYLQSYPSSGSYEIDVLDAHTVIGNLNFGNCPLDSCCVDEDAFIAVATTPVTVIRDSCMICISHPCIGWCQRLSIDWGDGTSSGYFEGIGSVDASHTYQQSGQYTICLKYEETQDNGDVCFSKDSCFTVCVQCGICESQTLAMNCFNFYEDSQIPTIDGVLANHSDYYIEPDGNGGYYTTGHTTSTTNQHDCFVSKYTEDCDLCWQFAITGDGSDQGLILKHFPGGFYVTGISSSINFTLPSGMGGTPLSFTNNSGEQRVFLAKYLDSGECGNEYIPELEWALIFGNNEYRVLVSDMDLDVNNNPILIGVFTDTLVFDEYVLPNSFPPSLETISGGNQDFYMVKFDGYNGQQLWSKSLAPSSLNTGGVYPLGISVEPGTKNFYVAGHFSQNVDFDNMGFPPDLSGGPIGNAAAFIAKFNDASGAPTLNWAFPILATGVDPSFHQGIATDIEAYPGGFAISVENYHGQIAPNIVYEFNPRGTPSVPVFWTNKENSYLIRYDSDGMHQCHYRIPKNNYINEISVDNNKNVYCIGGRNVGDNNELKPNQGYTFHNVYFGVLNNDCMMKEFIIDGSGQDDGWSIAPIGSDEFVIIGRSNSPNFKPNPSDPSENYTPGGDPGIPNTFIGKYSCECVIIPDTFNCCDQISISAHEVPSPEIMCVDSSCCYTTDLSNDAGFSIKSVAVNILTPGWIFGSVDVATGLSVSGSGTIKNIQNLTSGGNIPGGLTPDFFKFCLIGQIGSPNIQEIEFVYYEILKSGGCIAVCRDTIRTDCIAPTCAGNCLQVVDMSIVCDSTNPNQYCLFFNAENLSPFPATGVIIDVNSSDFGLKPCGGSGFSDPIQIVFGSPLNPGEISTQLCVKVISTDPVLEPEMICFNFGLNFADTAQCFQDSTYCLEIVPCCDPCEGIAPILTPISTTNDSCCYQLDIANTCAIPYINKIALTFLPVGSDVSIDYLDPSWNISVGSSGEICLNYNGGYIPEGLLDRIIEFCYLDFNEGLEPSIVLKYYSNVTADSSVCVCSDTLGFECRTCKGICENNIVQNGNFQEGLIAGNLGGPGNVNNWSLLTATPQVVSHLGGCENGAMLMWGNAVVGESIFQDVSFNPCYTYEICYSARRYFNAGQEFIGEVRMKAVDGLAPNYEDCPTGTCEEIIPLPNGLTNNWETYTVTWTPDQPYNTLIISPWSTSMINNGANVSWIVIDDICIRVVDSCKCTGSSDLLVFNDEFSINTSCDDPSTLEIPCQKNSVSFNIFSEVTCSQDCGSNVFWKITDPASIVIISGIIPMPSGGGSFGLSGLPLSIFTEETVYTLNIVSYCGCDSCVCTKDFIIKACDTCCKPEQEFLSVVNSAIHITVDNSLCKATLTFDELDCNIQIASIKWESGVTDFGPFLPGSMVMHSYSPANVSYLVNVTVVEYDENGNICNSTVIRIPVSLNCKNCCKKGIQAHKQWASLIAQKFAVKTDGCLATVTAPQFGDCYFFETTPDWGDGTSVVTGPFPATGSWSHSYATSGTYTICVVVSEYPQGNPNLEPCRSKQMCTTVKVDCDDPCVCDGFSDLSLYYDKEQKVKTHCKDTLTLECPPDDCIWIFSGNLLCKNDCPESLVNWNLVESSSGTVVASGTSVAFPGFGIYIPPVIVTEGGEYDLILNGQCGPYENCPCSIHLIFPGCDEICPCDPDDLVRDVEAGISTYTILDNCTACFRPLALQECDMVNWYLLPHLNQIATSLGNQLVCYDFRLPGVYRIKMEVTRKNADGTVCAVYEKIFTLNINCSTFPAPDSEPTECFENAASSFPISEWMTVSADMTKSFTELRKDFIVLKGNLNKSDIVFSPFPVCLNQTNAKLKLRIRLDDNARLRPGTRLVFGQIQDPTVGPAFWKKHETLTTIQLEDLPRGIIHIESPLSLSNNPIPGDCIDNEHSLVYITIHLVNDLSNELINADSELEIHEICLGAGHALSAVDSKDNPDVRVIPNPTSHAFHLEINNVKYMESQVEVYDQFGKKLEFFTLPKQTSQLQFGADYLPGLYLLKLNGPHDTRVMKLIKTGH